MEKRRLGRTELWVSILGFGCGYLRDLDGETASQVVNTALDLGVNYFDVAPNYGDGEEKLGDALGNRREKCLIATKTEEDSKSGTLRLLKQSLKHLKTDIIDVYQLHNIKTLEKLDRVLAPNGALAGMKEAKKQGLIKFIGITGHEPDILVEALKTGEFDTVMAKFSPLDRRAASSLIPLAKDKDVGLVVMKPFALGALIRLSPENRNILEGKNLGTVAEYALRYIQASPISTIIPGMKAIREVEANARYVSNKAPLTTDETRWIEELGAELSTLYCRINCHKCEPCPKGVEINNVINYYEFSYYNKYSNYYNIRHKSCQHRVQCQLTKLLYKQFRKCIEVFRTSHSDQQPAACSQLISRKRALGGYCGPRA